MSGVLRGISEDMDRQIVQVGGRQTLTKPRRCFLHCAAEVLANQQTTSLGFHFLVPPLSPCLVKTQPAERRERWQPVSGSGFITSQLTLLDLDPVQNTQVKGTIDHLLQEEARNSELISCLLHLQWSIMWYKKKAEHTNEQKYVHDNSKRKMKTKWWQKGDLANTKTVIVSCY